MPLCARVRNHMPGGLGRKWDLPVPWWLDLHASTRLSTFLSVATLGGHTRERSVLNRRTSVSPRRAAFATTLRWKLVPFKGCYTWRLTRARSCFPPWSWQLSPVKSLKKVVHSGEHKGQEEEEGLLSSVSCLGGIPGGAGGLDLGTGLLPLSTANPLGRRDTGNEGYGSEAGWESKLAELRSLVEDSGSV